MRKMKVLLCVREDYQRNFQGDSKKVIETYNYLKKNNIEVKINSGHIADYSNFDIIHLFNITRVGEIYKYYKLAHQAKKCVIISPIYWNITKYYKFKNDFEKVRLFENSQMYRQKILKGCTYIIASSNLEKEALKEDFDIASPIDVVYSGVEVEDESVPLYNFRERYKLNNYVLCVGCISVKKNQLTLAKVCNNLGIQLVLIGKVKDKDYFKQCIKFNNVMYLGFMDSYNIYNAYRFAKVHALVSFIEKPGMSSLEAAASGCNILSTIEGSAKEYFKDMAEYCNPYSEEDIYEALNRCFNRRKDSKLKKYVKENYNWSNYIKKVKEIYLKAESNFNEKYKNKC
ncbi:glycosyltransferase family 4 protein [Haloimpatiens sp. FM7315]|uniref:glycosyltransferase family 4 protein n=1 Tax=Haloimpatiens sp. FM7315 TaxID=3298609 RepID=UPI003977DA30